MKKENSSSNVEPGQQVDSLDSEWLTADQAVRYLSLVSRKSLYAHVSRGRIPAGHLGRLLRFRREDLDKALMNSSFEVDGEGETDDTIE